MRSPSPSNATPRSSRSSRPSAAAARRSVAPQPTLMFVPSGSSPIAVTSAPSCSNACGAMLAVRAVRAVDGDPQPVRSEPKRSSDVLEVAVGRDARRGRSRRRRARRRRGAPRSAPRLVAELLAVAVEELDAVVLGRVVRGGDDDAEVEREQRDRRRRQHAGEDARCRRPTRCRARTPPRARRPEARVSRPTKTRPRPDQSATALPSRSTSSGVSSRRRRREHRRCRSRGAPSAGQLTRAG